MSRPTDRWAMLIEAWCDGTIGAADRQRLEQAVTDDPAIRQLFIDQAQTHLTLTATLTRPTKTQLNVLTGAVLSSSASNCRRAAERVAADLDLRQRPASSSARSSRRLRVTGSSSRRRTRRQSRPRPTGSLALAVVLFLVAGIGFWWWQEQQAQPQPQPDRQPVELANKEHPLLKAGTLSGPCQWDTSLTATTQATIALPDGTRLVVDTGSRIRLTPRQCLIEYGRLHATVSPQPPEDPWRVRSAHCTTTVLGTAFSVDVTPERSRLVMDHGRVQISNPAGNSTILTAGQAGQADDQGLHTWTREQPVTVLVAGAANELHRDIVADLQAEGYTIRQLLDNTITTADLETADAIIIFEPVNSIDLDLTPLRHWPGPVFCGETHLFDDLGLQSADLPGRSFSGHVTVNPKHPITRGLDTSLQLHREGLNQLWSPLPAGATPLLTRQDDRSATAAFVLPATDTQGVRTSCLVGLGARLGNEITPAGRDILRRTVLWTVEEATWTRQ